MNQRTDEWFEIRKGKFTGSEIWKLMVEPKNKNESLSETAKGYIIEKIVEQYSIDDSEPLTTISMQWGIDNEPLAKKWYSKFTGNSITDCTYIHHKLFPMNAGGSPDGYLENKNAIIEIKCPYNGVNHIKHIMTESQYMKQECKDYYWQMQFYMMIMDADYCDFISFDPRINHSFGMHIKKIERNDIDIDLMNKKIQVAIDYKEQIENRLMHPNLYS